MPFELRPAPAPTLKPEGEYLQTAWQRSVYPLANQLGITMKLPEVSPQPCTNLAFQGLEYAKDHRTGDAYNDAVFRAFFQQSRDIGDIDVLTEIATDVGLDADEFRQALARQTHRDRVQDLLLTAHRSFGVAAVPTMIIGQHRLEGLYPTEAIRQAIDDQLARRAAS